MAVDTALADPGTAASGSSHPLDPLTGAEIERTAAIVQGSDHTSDTLRFVMISLAEPPKPANLVFEETPARKAFTVAYDNAEKMIYEGVVDLDLGIVESWTPVPMLPVGLLLFSTPAFPAASWSPGLVLPVGLLRLSTPALPEAS